MYKIFPVKGIELQYI